MRILLVMNLIEDNHNKYRNEIYCKSKRNERINYTKSKNKKLYYPHLLKRKIHLSPTKLGV
jgi:hypothetical protein